jgi:aminoglycoside phosphotransferase (APT) family kinase protein
VRIENAADVQTLVHSHGLQGERLVAIESGWDSVVYEVDGDWIFRFPRRPEVVDWVRAEAMLLPRLAPRLPVAVPQFEIVVFDDVSYVAYRKLRGEPLRSGIDSAPLGAAVAAFLAALHALPVEGMRERIEVVPEFRRRVLPLLDADERSLGESLLRDASSADFDAALVHGDLGPEHLLHAGDELTGVIDWSDAHAGDPALDFAWTLFGTGPRFVDALAETYGVSDALRARGLVFHKLGPWHEVLYGLESNQPQFVASGLAGLRERLRL